MSTPNLNFTPIEKRANEELSRDLARFVRVLDKIESHRPDGCQPPAAPNMRSLVDINRDLNSVDDYFRQLANEPMLETPRAEYESGVVADENGADLNRRRCSFFVRNDGPAMTAQP